ncbi:flagellar filament capping protein FliD [Solibacillus daqui]|uniref:flagellar filament capping protein FliD n=1 Tax=Solibacillus daqui TaxID=2912187 RepID=UPI002365ECFB|nr:flagellar filament capping protein FliD [Solibacillus daqui]
MVMRVGGLASGMDIDELVKKLMQAERAPLDKLFQKKTTYEWQRDAYRGVNTKLKTFDTYVRDNLSLKTLNSKTATSSNSSLVSATATGKASGTLSIEGVSQLAEASRITSGQVNATGSTKMKDLASGPIEFTAVKADGTPGEPTSIEITDDMTVDDFVKKVNESGAGVSAVFENGRFSFTAKNTGKGSIQITGGTPDMKLTKDEGASIREGKNAIFQVNGIATERASNSFSINGYNVTLKSTFNGEQATAERYNGAYTEWKFTTTPDYINKIAEALNSSNTASDKYTEAYNKFLAAKEDLFGSDVSAEDQTNFSKIKNPEFARSLTEGEVNTLKAQSFADDAAYQTWLNDDTTDADLKAKLKSENITLDQAKGVQALDYNKIQKLSAHSIYNSIGSKAMNQLTTADLSTLRLKGFSDEEAYQTWLNDDTTDPDLKAKLKEGNVNLEQFNSLKTVKDNELTAMQNQSKYSTLGAGFLSGLSAAEQGLLNGAQKGTVEDFNKQIDTWKNSTNAEEKALGEKLSKLSDSQKNALREMDSTQLTDFSDLANKQVDAQAKLADKTAKEAEYKALEDRQTKAKADFKDAYKQQFKKDYVDGDDPGLIDENNIPTGTTPPVTMTSTTNVDDMMQKIEDFVNTYNGLIKDLTNQTKESKYRDYKPLSDEQKKDMSENEIKLWEEKAKSGLLRSDALLQKGLADMRSLVYETNPGLSDSKFNSLFSVGITTTKNFTEGGILEIDKDKLRKAIEEDPDAVEKLFKNSDGKKDAVVDGETVDTRGYVDKLRDSLKSFEVSIEKKAGRSTMTDAQYSIGKSLVDTEKRISTWQDKLKMIEARYWKQFGAMESAINKANSQASMFMQG